jgi:hypothetical protein
VSFDICLRGVQSEGLLFLENSSEWRNALFVHKVINKRIRQSDPRSQNTVGPPRRYDVTLPKRIQSTGTQSGSSAANIQPEAHATMPLKGNQYIFVGVRKILRLIRASLTTSNFVIENNRGCMLIALLPSHDVLLRVRLPENRVPRVIEECLRAEAYTPGERRCCG